MSDHSPIVNSWFREGIEVVGKGRVEFENPPGYVSGPATTRWSIDGSVTVEISIEEAAGHETLPGAMQQLLSGEAPARTGNGLSFPITSRVNHCKSLSIETANERFEATEKITQTNVVLWLGGQRSSELSFAPLRSTIRGLRAGSAKYWVIPLTNLVYDMRVSFAELDRHPLRIFPTPTIPDGLDAEARDWARLIANQQNRLIAFAYNGDTAFIEALPDYRNRVAALKSGIVQNQVTAVMVGPVGSNPCGSISELLKWFPLDFIYLLGLTTGTPIGAPWIEIRDDSGQLCQRFNISWKGTSFVRGHPAVPDTILNGIGALFNSAINSGLLGKSLIRVVLQRLIQAGSYGGSLEDQWTDLARAADALCAELGLRTTDLLQSLNPATRATVTALISDAARKIRTVGGGLGLSERPAVEMIASRVQSAANKDSNFGPAVAALARHFGLADAEILNPYCATSAAWEFKPWTSILSEQRGRVIHRAYFDIRDASQDEDIERVYVVKRHLHDLLLRIVFQLLGYKSYYQPTTTLLDICKNVDWVDATTGATELGF
jgi:hypothetical protein